MILTNTETLYDKFGELIKFETLGLMSDTGSITVWTPLSEKDFEEARKNANNSLILRATNSPLKPDALIRAEYYNVELKESLGSKKIMISVIATAVRFINKENV